MEIFRGDTFKFEFSATLEDGTTHTFQTGDILKVGLKVNNKSPDYLIYEERKITEETDTIIFEFSHKDMMKVTTRRKTIRNRIN